MMSTPLSVLKYKTGSDKVGLMIKEDYKPDDKRIYQNLLEMVHSISNMLENARVEAEFIRYIPNVSTVLKDLNKTLQNEDLTEIKNNTLLYYNLLRKNIEKIDPEIRLGVFEILDSLQDFDTIYLDIAQTREKELEQALNEIIQDGDIQDFEDTIAGTALIFFSMLLFTKYEIKNGKTLKSLLEIAHEYSKALGSWADTIDIMSNPQSVEAMKEAEKIAAEG